jgi:hypothetical protein
LSVAVLTIVQEALRHGEARGRGDGVGAIASQIDHRGSD